MNVTPFRALIVEDNPDNARMLQALLKQEGYATRIATDGPTALEAARISPPDVVLLDIGMDGSAPADELRRITEFRDRRLVTCDGKDALPSPSPFDRHFQKPLPPEALLAYLAGIQHEPTRSLAAAVA
jgi:CheY-like chemotaxis protein